MIRKIIVTLDADGEYRIPSEDGREAGACYADDKQDMLDTARKQYNNPRLKVRIILVFEHPEGI